MNEIEDAPTLPAGVTNALCEDPAVQFVVAFGSRVEGGARPSSDLDVAIKFDERCTDEERFRKRCHFLGHLQEREMPSLDIVDLETVPLTVAHAAVNGELLCGDAAAFETTRNEIEAAFTDRREDIERRQRTRIQRIADEGLHG